MAPAPVSVPGRELFCKDHIAVLIAISIKKQPAIQRKLCTVPGIYRANAAFGIT